MGGRPSGSKDRVPRGSVKAAFEEIIATSPALITEAIRRGLQGRNALGFIDLWAKVGKEIGTGAETGAPRVLIVRGLDVDSFGAEPRKDRR